MPISNASLQKRPGDQSGPVQTWIDAQEASSPSRSWQHLGGMSLPCICVPVAILALTPMKSRKCFSTSASMQAFPPLMPHLLRQSENLNRNLHQRTLAPQRRTRRMYELHDYRHYYSRQSGGLSSLPVWGISVHTPPRSNISTHRYTVDALRADWSWPHHQFHHARRCRPHTQRWYGRRGHRAAYHSHWSRTGRYRKSYTQHIARDLAGQCFWPLPAQTRRLA